LKKNKILGKYISILSGFEMRRAPFFYEVRKKGYLKILSVGKFSHGKRHFYELEENH